MKHTSNLRVATQLQATGLLPEQRQSHQMATAGPTPQEPLPTASAAGIADIKPIVSHLMRQMRSLRNVDQVPQHMTQERIKQIEGTLRNLYTFLDVLDDGYQPDNPPKPTIPATRGEQVRLTATINARVPSVRPSAKTAKPPSIFRRRPD